MDKKKNKGALVGVCSQGMLLRGWRKGRWDTSFIVALHISVFRSSRHCVKTHSAKLLCSYCTKERMRIMSKRNGIRTPLAIVNDPGM